MMLREGENNPEPSRNITAGQIVFCIIITGSIAGVIYLLIRKYRIEH